MPAPATKRENAFVSGNFLQAREVLAYLKAKKVDAILVTKFAVQVHPAHVPLAEEAIYNYDPDWRCDGRYRTAS